MSEDSANDGNRMNGVNWPGVLVGVLMFFIPFSGAWWRVSVGDVLDFAVSPFYYEINVMGSPMTISLLEYAIPAMQLLFLIGGVAVIVGSVSKGMWWEEQMKRFGLRKAVWIPVSFTVMLFIGALLLNSIFPQMVQMNEMDPEAEQMDVDPDLPYVVGSSNSVVEMDSMTVSAPVEKSLTGSFWLAFITVFLAVLAAKYDVLR